jgi:methionyl-tRNA formyltransferase
VGPVRLRGANELEPGELQVTKSGVAVGTATLDVELGVVQPPGKKPMAAADWARGARIAAGERLA